MDNSRCYKCTRSRPNRCQNPTFRKMEIQRIFFIYLSSTSIHFQYLLPVSTIKTHLETLLTRPYIHTLTSLLFFPDTSTSFGYCFVGFLGVLGGSPLSATRPGWAAPTPPPRAKGEAAKKLPKLYKK